MDHRAIKFSIKLILLRFEDTFNVELYHNVRKIRKLWSNSNLLNAIRRLIGFGSVRLKIKIMQRKNSPLLKLHLGCGEKNFDGYINIDWRKTGATDLVCDIKKLPYLDKSAEVIESYHVIEHLSIRDFTKALKEWNRILAPGGKLVIECPDFDKALQEYFEGNDERLFSVFGLQRFPGNTHLWGYNAERLKTILHTTGFTKVLNLPPQDYHKEDEPCLRIEAYKLKL
jgi:predicted SAM-dependent methyltransferase